MCETKNHGPDKGDKSPGRWEGCCCRAPGATVNTAEFRRNSPRENRNIASRQLNFALHVHVGFSEFKCRCSSVTTSRTQQRPPVPQWVSHRDLFIRTAATRLYPSSGIGLCDVLTYRAKADMCYEAERPARARCVYGQTLQARSLVCPGRVPGAHTHLAHVLGALWPPASRLAHIQKQSSLRFTFCLK